MRVGLHTWEDYPISPLRSSPPLSLVSSFPFSSLHADWLLLWPRVCRVPTNSVGAGREYEYTQGSHWQVSLVIIGQAGHRGSKRLLTLMIWVCFQPTPISGFQATVVLAQVQRMTSSEGDRQGFHRQMVVRSNNDYLQVPAQTNAYYLVGNDHYQSRTSLSTSGEFINRKPQ